MHPHYKEGVLIRHQARESQHGRVAVGILRQMSLHSPSASVAPHEEWVVSGKLGLSSSWYASNFLPAFVISILPSPPESSGPVTATKRWPRGFCQGTQRDTMTLPLEQGDQGIIGSHSLPYSDPISRIPCWVLLSSL